MCGGVGGFIGDLFNVITLGMAGTGSSSKKPKTVVSPQTYSNSNKEADEKAVSARDAAKKKAQQMLGRKSTILTGSEGLTSQAQTVKKTLLGS